MASDQEHHSQDNGNNNNGGRRRPFLIGNNDDDSNSYRNFILSIGFDRELLEQVYQLAVEIDKKKSRYLKRMWLIAQYATAVARLLGKSANEINEVKCAAVLHGLTELSSEDGKFATEESFYALLLKQKINIEHPEDCSRLNRIYCMLKYQFENFDGSGLPDGLAGNSIPFGARIIHACRNYVLLVGVDLDRMPPEQVLEEIMRKSSSVYDPEIAEALYACITQGIFRHS